MKSPQEQKKILDDENTLPFNYQSYANRQFFSRNIMSYQEGENQLPEEPEQKEPQAKAEINEAELRKEFEKNCECKRLWLLQELTQSGKYLDISAKKLDDLDALTVCSTNLHHRWHCTSMIIKMQILNCFTWEQTILQIED